MPLTPFEARLQATSGRARRAFLERHADLLYQLLVTVREGAFCEKTPTRENPRPCRGRCRACRARLALDALDAAATPPSSE
jgi:hypothetical protein